MSSVIVVEGLSKKYIIGHQTQGRYTTLRDVLAGGARRFTHKLRHPFVVTEDDPSHEEFWALKDVSFEIAQGDRVGIVGRNGAGKSTLLKILSRITEPTSGQIRIRGRVSSLLEVGTGFHPELTGRENIFLNGTILGMRKAEIKNKFDEIVAFSEVEKFLDTPVKHYSSGMYVRLAFAVAAHLESEILIMDEVLAVGDVAFQKKCLGKMEDVSRDGRTVLFVTHGMQAVKSMCNRGIFLDKGIIALDGNVSDVVAKYLQPGKDEMTEVSYLDQDIPIQFSNVRLAFDQENQEAALVCTYKVRGSADAALLCVEVMNEEDTSVFYANDEFWRYSDKRRIGVHTAILRIPSAMFAPGKYSVAFGFWEPGRDPLHFPKDRLTFVRDERILTRLSAHNVRWPSVIYCPYSKWESSTF